MDILGLGQVCILGVNVYFRMGRCILGLGRVYILGWGRCVFQGQGLF